MVLVYTSFKPYISKICNDFSLYIYIYILDLNSKIFTLNNSLSTKLYIKWDTWCKNENLIEFSLKFGYIYIYIYIDR